MIEIQGLRTRDAAGRGSAWHAPLAEGVVRPPRRWASVGTKSGKRGNARRARVAKHELRPTEKHASILYAANPTLNPLHSMQCVSARSIAVIHNEVNQA